MKKVDIELLILKLMTTAIVLFSLYALVDTVIDAFYAALEYEWVTFGELFKMYGGFGWIIVIGVMTVMHELLDWGLSLPDDKEDEITV